MQAVGVEEVLALLVTFDAAFGAADALARYSPKKAFALIAIRRRRGGPQHEIVRRRRRDWIYQRLQCLFVHMHFLESKNINCKLPNI